MRSSTLISLVILSLLCSSLVNAGDPLHSSSVPSIQNVKMKWGEGFEGQRKGDLGNGQYRNPIIAGDHPDPSILKDGENYYMTFSSFDSYPGLTIWHSTDMVNWRPLTAALQQIVGSVWAPELIKHGNRYYIYFPGRLNAYRSNYVIWSESIDGPWSDPIDMKNSLIDPGHAVDEHGKRFLFLSGGYYAPLSDDGLSITGDVKKIYDGWKYPDDWIVESFSQEGPKITRIGEYYYMILAEGGTAGPPTGHMIISARSKSLHGPWENSPYNPIARTLSADEYWWSKGHGTLVQSPDRKWWMVYHAYEKNFMTLGRQTMLEPITLTKDGWLKFSDMDAASPFTKPVKSSGGIHGFPFSDDFSTNKMGLQWNFYQGGKYDTARFRYEKNAIVIKGKGSSPANSSPLCFVNGELSYQIEVQFELIGNATAGLLLFYNSRSYGGLAFNDTSMVLHRYGLDRVLAKPASIGRTGWIRLVNHQNLVSIYYSSNGQEWTRHDVRMDVSGYHHNTFYDFLSLRPAIYASGEGEVRFKHFTYRTLP